MPAGPACWRRPAASSSAAITRASSSPPIRTTGRKLFQFQTGAAIYAPPTSYAIDGRQYVVIPSGATLTAFALPRRAGSR